MPDPTGPQGDVEVRPNEGLSLPQPGRDPSSAPSQGVSDGLSAEQLPEEYKPYNDYLPWEQIPDEVRDDALQGLKKFHGSMTRDHQELKRQLASHQEKANFLDYLYQQPEIQRALQSISGRGQGQTQGQAVLDGESADANSGKLSDFGIDPEVEKLLQQSTDSRVKQAVEPLLNQVNALKQQIADREVRDQLQQLKATAERDGLPDPNERLSQIREIIANRRASSLEDAYRLSIQEDLPKIYSEKAKREYQDKMTSKAQNTMPPGVGPSLSPHSPSFTGSDAVEKALSAAEQELNLKL
jgi:hypothetical protein